MRARVGTGALVMNASLRTLGGHAYVWDCLQSQSTEGRNPQARDHRVLTAQLALSSCRCAYRLLRHLLVLVIQFSPIAADMLAEYDEWVNPRLLYELPCC